MGLTFTPVNQITEIEIPDSDNEDVEEEMLAGGRRKSNRTYEGVSTGEPRMG